MILKKDIFLLLVFFISACSTHSFNTASPVIDQGSENIERQASRASTDSNSSLSDQKTSSLSETGKPQHHSSYEEGSQENAFSSSRDSSWSLRPDPAENEYKGTSDLSEQAEDKSDQAIFDSALEFCQTSSDLWDQGDLDGAIASLDQAYALILTVDLKRSPELLQQVEDLRFTISKRIVEIYSSRHTAVNGYHTAIPMVINHHVEKALYQLKGPERNFFINAYQRSGKYRPFILRALKDAGLPEELSWLPLIESGFKVRALSTARALGLWQFIASTGYKYGLKRGTWIDERMDPEKSTMAAIEYLKELHQIFGDWTTALAAYNCGEGAVLRFLKTQRINYLDNFWDLYEKLPQETASYVPRFLAVLHIIKDPAAHGFDLPPLLEEIPVEKVKVERPIHLQTIALNLSVPYELLVEINAELRQDATPDRAYELRLPVGKASQFLVKAADMQGWSPPPPQHYLAHRVAKGETIYSIARKYKTTPASIISFNKLQKGVNLSLRTGMELKIPRGKRHPTTLSPLTERASAAQQACPPAYIVKKGDTLSSISRQFKINISTIKALNNLKDTRLHIGQVLTLSDSNRVRAEASKPRTYRVVKGDSPNAIAMKHHIPLKDLLRINNLTSQSTIYPGQLLVVSLD